MLKRILLTSSALIASLALTATAYAGNCNDSKKTANYQASTAAHDNTTTYKFERASYENVTYGKSYDGKKSKYAKKDIVDTAVANGSFNTLAAALDAAGLIDTLKGEGPFTVFAPTDEAFAKLPEGTVEKLLLPENKDKLVSILTYQILTYHVVAGKVKARDVVKLTSATTVQGSDITVKVIGDRVMIDNANVVLTDVKASNGIIHVIDSVILPK